MTKPLTDLQLELSRKLAEAVVEGMDMADLCTYAIEQLTLAYEGYTEEQLIAEAQEYYPDLLEDVYFEEPETYDAFGVNTKNSFNTPSK